MPAAETWRLLDLEAGRGDWNMAVDEALLESAANGQPTLRLFTWSEHCLSIGCLQSIADVDVEACQRADLPVVRRASGGTAVLHECTFAFSLVVPAGHPLAVSDIVESYRQLGPPAREALRRLGVSTEFVRLEEAHRGPPRGLGSAACFAALAPYELVVGSRKLVGNSQLRRRGAILHHAIIPLDFSPGRFAGFLRTSSLDELRRLAAILEIRIGSVAGTLGHSVADSEVAAAIRSAFADTFGITLVPGSLTGAEETRARELLREKYRNPAWTYRR